MHSEQPDEYHAIHRYSGSEDGKMHNDLKLERIPMKFNQSAMTTTSDQPETSQYSRNHTIEDFAEHQSEDSFDDLDQIPERENVNKGNRIDSPIGPAARFEYGERLKERISALNFDLGLDPPLKNENFDGSQLPGTDDEDEDIEYRPPSRHPTGANIRAKLRKLQIPDTFDIPAPHSPGDSIHTMEMSSPQDTLFHPDDDESVTSVESVDDPLRRQISAEEARTDTEESTTLSVEHIYKSNTDPRLRKEVNDFCALAYHFKEPNEWNQHGIWAEIRHQINLDQISLRRRATEHFMRASKMYYMNNPDVVGELESEFESEDVIPASERKCFPGKLNHESKISDVMQRIYMVFDKSDTWTGSLIAVVIMLFILASLVSMCMETLPAYRFPNYGDDPEDIAPIFGLLEIICVVIFTVEYATRIYTAGFATWKQLGTTPPPPAKDTPFRKRLYFFLGALNMIDFLAILPFYIEMLTNSSGLSGSLTILRLLRLLRVLRLFKLGRHIHSLRVYARVMVEVAPALVILLLFLTFLWVIGSSLMYISESGAWDDNFVVPGTNITGTPVTGAYTRHSVPAGEKVLSPFTSVLVSLWWAISTYSLVGYGEIVPTSFSGYAIGIVFMILGIIALSLPIGLVATAYRDVSERYDHDFVTTEAHSIKILEMLKEAQEKVTDLEVLLENGLKKFNDRHRKLIVRQTRSYNNVLIGGD